MTQTHSPSAPSARVAAGAPTDDEQFAAFEISAAAELALPTDGHVVGEPVNVMRIRYPGRPRIGLLATCHRGEHTYDVSLADLVFPHASAAAKLVARYRAWLGFDTADELAWSVGHPRPHKVASDDITVGKPVELVVLACKSNALRCRLLGSTREVTLRTAVRYEIPGSIITVTPTKQWTHARHPYLSGAVERMRVDVGALGLVPLALRNEGEWDPEDEYWGEEGDPIGEWAKPIIARGKRPAFEMEQVIPGADPNDFDSDPIIEASERSQAGDPAGASALLMKLLAEDLRCLDAHAHLGNVEFKRAPKQAVRHYEMGAAIGALSLGTSFDGVLPWGHIDNRPFLRCLNGTGLCAWRLGDRRSAAAVFEKMLWLNPGDHQGARFNLAAVSAGKTWEEMEDSEQ
ncbi:MAG TPA: hypothetical protein VLM79_21750 [Kofleriaceae bacterium]|nr:hypothetical protein [Kofleriaceae bacterium]